MAGRIASLRYNTGLLSSWILQDSVVSSPNAVDLPIRRVLILAPTPFFGDRGCHVRIYEEARGLSDEGVEVLVATYPTGRDVTKVNTRRPPAVPGLKPRVLGPSYSRPMLDALLCGTAVRVARRFKPQVLHAHLHEGILIGTIVRKICGAPLVADLQGSLKEELIDHGFLRQDTLAASACERVERWLVHRPDAVLVSSAAGIPLLRRQGLQPDRIESLTDGVDLQRFRPLPADDGLTRRLGLSGKKVVVFLGVLTEYQGVDVLLEAVPDVARAVPDVHFLLLGYPNEAHYRALVSARSLTDRVTIPGRVPYEEAAGWLCLGTVAVSPKRSLTESNGKLLNYMACGLPVVATDTTVNRELLGEAGVYTPVGNARTLATALIELLNAPDRSHTLGAALRRRAETQFAWPMLIRRLLDVYRRVSCQGPAAVPMV